MEYKRGIPAYKDADGNTFGLLAETKEECITDDTGEKLSDKLVKIQDGMYTIPEGEKIHFKRGDGNADFTLSVGEKGIKANTALESTSWVGQVLEFVKGAKLVVTETGFNMLSPGGYAIAEINDIGMFCKQVYIANDHAVWFNNVSGSGKYRLFCDGSNNLVLQCNIDGTWTDAFMIDFVGHLDIRNSTYVENLVPICFNLTNGQAMWRILVTSGNMLKFERNASGTWTPFIEITSTGLVSFANNISAPNIASATALTAAEQEITDMDLQNIETQRAVTGQDITNIETQQTLTEMDLERIGGQTE